MRIKTEKSTLLFHIIGYAVISAFAIYCLLPFWLIISGSFTSEMEIIEEGFKIIPDAFSLEAYKAVFKYPEKIITAYEVTVGVTIVGTLLGLFLISMSGYVLSRRDFKFRNILAFYIYFTTLFSGGLIPWYILIVKYLHLKDSLLALVIPSIISAWNIILMKNFMKAIPESIVESARIDGAGDFTIYARIIMPLSTPGLATIGLFMALGYWNDWFMANIFINTESKFPLQFFLYRALADAQILKSNIATILQSANIQPPLETMKMAIAMVVTGPIIFLYPFVQKYFVKGLTIGAVKG